MNHSSSDENIINHILSKSEKDYSLEVSKRKTYIAILVKHWGNFFFIQNEIEYSLFFD